VGDRGGVPSDGGARVSCFLLKIKKKIGKVKVVYLARGSLPTGCRRNPERALKGTRRGRVCKNGRSVATEPGGNRRLNLRVRELLKKKGGGAADPRGKIKPSKPQKKHHPTPTPTPNPHPPPHQNAPTPPGGFLGGWKLCELPGKLKCGKKQIPSRPFISGRKGRSSRGPRGEGLIGGVALQGMKERIN